MNDNADLVKNADFVDLALERILAITWERNWDRRWSACALLKEYFRRVSLWRDALNPDPEERWRFYGYDLSSAVAPMPDIVREKIDTVWMAHLEARRRESLTQKQPLKMSRNERRRAHGPLFVPEGHSGVGHQADMDVEKYLHWCGVLDSPKLQEIDLPCPYEPVIRLYERGGEYHMHHGWWEVMMISFQSPGVDWYRSSSGLLALDDASLDEIDSAELQEVTAT